MPTFLCKHVHLSCVFYNKLTRDATTETQNSSFVHPLSSRQCNRMKKVSCLCPIDLSAAFDTTDHDISITHLSSWFGIHGSVLSWFKPYLSSRCFHVKCETDLSSWYTSSCGVPQGSVLGPLLFVMYTTPLSTLISSCSLNHQLYGDDTQLFLSFHQTHFDASINHLQNAPNRICT